MALRLIIEDEEGATTIVPLGEEEITIGREPGNTIQLTEQNVSRQHARLTPGSDGWVIEDLDSYNGVRVNGVLIEGTVNLNEGDVVQIGDYHLGITNNAEQTNLIAERSGGAATTDPVRVAPSMDLPRVAASEAAALVTPSAPPLEASHDDDHDDEPTSEGKGRGLLFALLAVFLVGGGFIAYQFVGAKPEPKRDNADVPVQVAEPEAAPEPKVEEPPEPKVEEPPEPPLPNDPVPEPATKEPPPDPPPDEPVKKPTPKPVKQPTPKPVKPAAPKGDPVQLLEDARKANLAGNATQAYDLAKKSYDINKNANALALMGASACKMGNQSKATSVFKKLTDPNRRKQMITVCAERGIMLE